MIKDIEAFKTNIFHGLDRIATVKFFSVGFRLLLTINQAAKNLASDTVYL